MIEDSKVYKLSYNIGKVIFNGTKYLSENLCKLLPVREYKEYYEARSKEQDSNLEKTIAEENLKISNLPKRMGLLKYLHKIDDYKKELKEKSIDDLKKMINKYKESNKSKWDKIWGIYPSKITAIQAVLEEKSNSRND